jgi:hypothetical protein
MQGLVGVNYRNVHSQLSDKSTTNIIFSRKDYGG